MNTLVWATALSLLPQMSSQQGPGHSSGSIFSRLNRVRTIDGTDNNVRNPTWGSVGQPFRRLGPVNYADGISAPAGANLASARQVSNVMSAQSGAIPNTVGASDFVWQWGQFLDHDIDETPVADPAEAFDIPVPLGDRFFDPFRTGVATIPLSRSLRVLALGQEEQVNIITSYIDASGVYGSDAERARELRTLDGTGKLKTSAGELLPFNEAGLHNAPSNSSSFFLAGDFRANEQVALTAMHTLFVREHNYWAERIARETGGDASGGSHGGGAAHGSGERRAVTHNSMNGVTLSGDEIYELARAIVAAEIQVITYRDFLPVVLGPGALAPYVGYQSNVDPSISNEFASAAYRFGHSMLSPFLRRLDSRGRTIPAGDLPLASAFFNPAEISAYGIDSILRGLASQRAQKVDNFVIDDVRNFLFGPPGAGGFDLPSLNIQRGRDHGLSGYNATRSALGLGAKARFTDVSSNVEVQRRLSAVYDDPGEIDLWIGGLCEDPLPGALVGETISAILREQFEALRDGDRFWYERSLPAQLVELVERQDLGRIIRRNTRIEHELQADVFRTN